MTLRFGAGCRLLLFFLMLWPAAVVLAADGNQAARGPAAPVAVPPSPGPSKSTGSQPPPAAPPMTAEIPEEAEAALVAQLAVWQSELDRATSTLARHELTDVDFETLRVSLTEIQRSAKESGGAVEDKLSTVRQLLDSLGKAPEEDQPPEAPAVAEERARLQNLVTRFSGEGRQLELIAVRANILLRTTNENRISQFAETIFWRGASPLLPATWEQIPVQAQFLRDRIVRSLGALWGAQEQWQAHQATALWLALAVLILGGALRHWMIRRFGQRRDIAAPSYLLRATAALAQGVADALIPVLLILAAAWLLLEVQKGLPLMAVIRALIRVVAGGMIFFVLIGSQARAVLAPHAPAWRLPEMGDKPARMLLLRLWLFAIGLSVSGAVVAFLESAVVAPELHAVVSFAAKLVGASALLAVVLPGKVWRRIERNPEPAPVAGEESLPQASERLRVISVVPKLRLLLGWAAVGIVVLSAFRFHNLGVYSARLILAGLAVIGAGVVLRKMGREGLHVLLNAPPPRLEGVRRILVHGTSDKIVVSYLGGLLLDLLVLLAGLAVLLPVSGIAWSEVKSWIMLFMRGITIGEVTLSPADIVSALALVVSIMGATRFVQRRLDERVFEHLPMDPGVRHSIRTGIGYAGAVVALLVGVAAVGLNLSNLALIAGALSVGIGFGLQAVVSNFVAGLILLVERPIKVGDWVVVGDKEGVVKRISVRATELQTFQRASVIIPNSDIISRPVINWTYKDKIGRIDIPVPLPYQADVDLVTKILIGLCKNDLRIAQNPPPRLVFKDFANGYLAMELRVFVADVDVYLSVATDLRLGILKAFREQDIPFPLASKTS